MPFNKTYSTYYCPNKDIIVRVNYAYGCTAKFRYVYNSIGQTYYGLEVQGFIEDFRGLIKACPDFFDNISGDSFEKELEGLGFSYAEMLIEDQKFYDMVERA